MFTRLLKSILGRLGWTMIRRGSQPMCSYVSARIFETADLTVRVFDHQEEATDLLRACAPYTMTSLARMMTLYELCRHFELTGCQGDFVECGVWRGGSAGIMAGANLKYGKTRRELWLYDSFEGLPSPVAADGKDAIDLLGGRDDGSLKPSDVCAAPESAVRELLDALGYPSEHTHIIKGWFQDTLPRAKPQRIAVLRLDGDWYESTRVCLEHLYPLVVQGGAVVIDDYGDWEGCKKAVDEYLAKHRLQPMLHHVDLTCRYFIKDH